MDTTKMYTAKQTITIAAPREVVWDWITKPELVKKYFFGTQMQADWKKGGEVFFRGEWEGKPYEDRGTVLEIEKHKLLKYNYWSNWSGKPDLPENRQLITYKLNDMGGNTEYVVEQEGVETEEAAQHSEKNWASVLEEMRKQIEATK